MIIELDLSYIVLNELKLKIFQNKYLEIQN